MTTQINLQKFVLPFAFTLALLRIIMDVVPKTLSFGAMAYYSTFFLAFIIEIIIITYVIKEFKKKNGTLILSQALKIGVIMMLITGLCYTITSYTYDTYIDPDYQINTALSFVERFNPDQVEATRTQMKTSLENKTITTDILGILTYTIWFIVLGFIISLIAGNVLKTREPNQ